MILNINNISKSYSKKTVLSSLSFEMDKPDIFALVAPNGAGKSTLLNCICNLIPIDSGSINIFNLKHNDPNIFKRVSYMQDNRILYPYLTGLDPGSVIRLRKLIKTINQEGSSFIISSHTLSKVNLITDKILFLKDGKLIYENIAYFKNMENKTTYLIHFSGTAA